MIAEFSLQSLMGVPQVAVLEERQRCVDMPVAFFAARVAQEGGSLRSTKSLKSLRLGKERQGIGRVAACCDRSIRTPPLSDGDALPPHVIST